MPLTCPPPRAPVPESPDCPLYEKRDGSASQVIFRLVLTERRRTSKLADLIEAEDSPPAVPASRPPELSPGVAPQPFPLLIPKSEQENF